MCLVDRDGPSKYQRILATGKLLSFDRPRSLKRGKWHHFFLPRQIRRASVVWKMADDQVGQALPLPLVDHVLYRAFTSVHQFGLKKALTRSGQWETVYLWPNV